MFFCSQTMLLVFVTTSLLAVVTARADFSQFFGKSINKEQAWGKLLEMEGCPHPELWDGTIIMVNESLAVGAKFISNPNVTSRYECEFECCYKQDQGCNMAIYTAAQRHCYLFACGQPSKCKFSQHEGYTVSSLSHAIVSSKESTTAPTTKPTTTQQSTTPAPPKQQHLLDGCRPSIDSCVTENTECSSTGFCTCKKGFHPKNGVCRRDCLEGLQFECTNGDPKFGSPDCVAVYDVCDGTPQCPDGSDEKGCDKDKFDWSKLADAPSLRATLEGNKQNSNVKSHAPSSSADSDSLGALGGLSAPPGHSGVGQGRPSDHRVAEDDPPTRQPSIMDKIPGDYYSGYDYPTEQELRDNLASLYGRDSALPSWYPNDRFHNAGGRPLASDRLSLPSDDWKDQSLSDDWAAANKWSNVGKPVSSSWGKVESDPWKDRWLDMVKPAAGRWLDRKKPSISQWSDVGKPASNRWAGGKQQSPNRWAGVGQQGTRRWSGAGMTPSDRWLDHDADWSSWANRESPSLDQRDPKSAGGSQPSIGDISLHRPSLPPSNDHGDTDDLSAGKRTVVAACCHQISTLCVCGVCSAFLPLLF